MPLIAYLVLAFIFFGSISFFIYIFFLEDRIQEVNWLLTDVVNASLLFLLLFLMTGATSMGLFLMEERKKASTYIIALVGVIPFAMGIYAFTGVVNGILDMERYLDGDFEIAEGVIEDY